MDRIARVGLILGRRWATVRSNVLGWAGFTALTVAGFTLSTTVGWVVLGGSLLAVEALGRES